MIEVESLRVEKLRLYLFSIIDEILNNKEYQINVDMLSNEYDNFSLDKIPTSSVVETWITGTEIHRDVFSFRNRKSYSQDTINNLKNIGFFEMFEEIIRNKNNNEQYPEIDGIEKIECLNCGTMLSADTNTAEFDIQIQITYVIN